MDLKLFSSEYPTFSPDYVCQGYIEDCWLISTLIALSMKENGKVLLRNIFSINADTTYTIKLFNEMKKPVYRKVVPEFSVSRETNELLQCGNGLEIPTLFAINSDPEYIWACTIEKAVLEFLGNSNKNHSYNAFACLIENKEIHTIYSYGLNRRVLGKIKTMQDTICCTLETNNTTTKLMRYHTYVLHVIIDDVWYLQNPHYSVQDTQEFIALNEDEIAKNVDLITYIVV